MTDEQQPGPSEGNGHVDEAAALKAIQARRDAAVHRYNEAAVFFAETMARVQKHREIHGKKPVDNRAVETDVGLLEIEVGSIVGCLSHFFPDVAEAIFNTMATQLRAKATAKAAEIGARRIIAPPN